MIDAVDPNGPAADAGLEQGDVIQEVNRQAIRSASDLTNAVAKSGNRPPLLLVNRGGQRVYVAVPLTR
jgi:serine protease Do